MKPSLVIFLAALGVAAAWPLLAPAPRPDARPAPASMEWGEANWAPREAALIRLPLTGVEARFARQFPGQIARFTDGERVWIVRVMDRPTRMLHPAADCFRGLGYAVETPRVRMDGEGQRWSCFTAEKKGRQLDVCERIFADDGRSWTDASSWYWSASRSGWGPWWAVTLVRSP